LDGIGGSGCGFGFRRARRLHTCDGRPRESPKGRTTHLAKQSSFEAADQGYGGEYA